MAGTSTAVTNGLRELHFHCFNCLRSELDRIEEAGDEHATGTGNWNPAQIVQHVAEVVTRSIDGFEFRAPLFARLMRPLLRAKLMGKPLPTGVKLKGGSAVLIPPESVRLNDAIALLRKELDRAEQQKMTADSPIFGKMAHEDWTDLHLRHAEMHFGFISLDG